MEKKKYFRRCGCCGDKIEQSGIIRNERSPNGWLCKDCYEYVFRKEVNEDDGDHDQHQT